MGANLICQVLLHPWYPEPSPAGKRTLDSGSRWGGPSPYGPRIPPPSCPQGVSPAPCCCGCCLIQALP